MFRKSGDSQHKNGAVPGFDGSRKTYTIKAMRPDARAAKPGGILLQSLPTRVDILVSNDVILAEVSAGLDLDQDHGNLAGILQPVT